MLMFAYHMLPFMVPPVLPPRPDAGRNFVNDPKFLRRIGVVVPAHKAGREIGDVLDRMLRYFEPEHIVVVDNANEPTPPDDTRDVLTRVHPLIKYIYVPQGHKTRALLVGTLALPPAVEYVLHVDDDTRLSDSMVFDEAKFSDDPRVAAVTFGIRMNGDSLTARLVDWEFVQFSILRTFQANRVSAFFCHGIIGLWRRELWTERLLVHPSMPYGEDNWIGCDAMTHSQRIAAELRCHVSTFAPSRLLPPMLWEGGAREQGYGASSVWKQRALRWYTNAPRRVPFRLRQLVFYQAGSLSANLWMRTLLLVHLGFIAVALSLPFLLASMALRTSSRELPGHLLGGFCKISAARFGYSCASALIVRCRSPQLMPSAQAVLLYPLYLAFLDLALVFGHWRCLLWYQPFWHLRRSMPARWAASAQAEASGGGSADGCSLSSPSLSASLSSDVPTPPASPSEPEDGGAQPAGQASAHEPSRPWVQAVRALARELAAGRLRAAMPALRAVLLGPVLEMVALLRASRSRGQLSYRVAEPAVGASGQQPSPTSLALAGSWSERVTPTREPAGARPAASGELCHRLEAGLRTLAAPSTPTASKRHAQLL